MKLSESSKSMLAFSMLASLILIIWNCNTERIGPKDPSPIEITKIVEDLATARTQTEVELALQHLLDKTGIGQPIRGSRYNDYILPGDFVVTLAQAHFRYLNDNDYALTWGETFEIDGLGPDENGVPLFSFDEVVTRFGEQASAALSNPESPNNALLLAITANGADIPNQIGRYDENTTLSAVQDFLLTVWFDYEFLAPAEGADVIQASTKKVKFDVMSVECPKGNVKKTGTFTVEFDKKNKQLEVCLKGGKKIFTQEIKDCKKTFKQEKKSIGEAAACVNLTSCVDAANSDLLDWIDNCEDQFHDQGGGN
jgi:hypothetical protein